MADATRIEALNWCREKMCDFKSPVYPPPSGWMWAESGAALVLAPIFTMTDQGEEISSVEAGVMPSSWASRGPERTEDVCT